MSDKTDPINDLMYHIIKRSINMTKIKIIMSGLITIGLGLIPNYLFVFYILPGGYMLANSIFLNKLITIKNSMIRSNN